MPELSETSETESVKENQSGESLDSSESDANSEKSKQNGASSHPSETDATPSAVTGSLAVEEGAVFPSLPDKILAKMGLEIKGSSQQNRWLSMRSWSLSLEKFSLVLIQCALNFVCSGPSYLHKTHFKKSLLKSSISVFPCNVVHHVNIIDICLVWNFSISIYFFLHIIPFKGKWKLFSFLFSCFPLFHSLSLELLYSWFA